MMYESPINIILGEMSVSFDNEIIKAVRKFDVQVDKDELLKAMNYDRQQYEKGFNDCMKQYVVRCKECKNWRPQVEAENMGLGTCSFHNAKNVTSEGYCYWAEEVEE